MSYAENLKRERLRRLLTQQELADKIGVTQGAISQYESGKMTPTVETSVRIAKLFGTTVERMLEG